MKKAPSPEPKSEEEEKVEKVERPTTVSHVRLNTGEEFKVTTLDQDTNQPNIDTQEHRGQDEHISFDLGSNVVKEFGKTD